VFISPEDVDRRMNWRPGNAERLARQRRLPYILTPDGSIRFDWADLERLIVRVGAVALTTEGPHHAD
jgi:hypothetical protein